MNTYRVQMSDGRTHTVRALSASDAKQRAMNADRSATALDATLVV